jgi:hypothetical protein
MEWELKQEDQKAAWDMYVELLTRITTQPLDINSGDEKTALDSVYSLFPTTRAIIKTHGKDCLEFSKLAIVILNQIVRPFTAKWHKLSLAGAFNDPLQCRIFRNELEELQGILVIYTQMLGEMAGVEDIQDLTRLL